MRQLSGSSQPLGAGVCHGQAGRHCRERGHPPERLLLPPSTAKQQLAEELSENNKTGEWEHPRAHQHIARQAKRQEAVRWQYFHGLLCGPLGLQAYIEDMVLARRRLLSSLGLNIYFMAAPPLLLCGSSNNELLKNTFALSQGGPTAPSQKKKGWTCPLVQ